MESDKPTKTDTVTPPQYGEPPTIGEMIEAHRCLMAEESWRIWISEEPNKPIMIYNVTNSPYPGPHSLGQAIEALRFRIITLDFKYKTYINYPPNSEVIKLFVDSYKKKRENLVSERDKLIKLLPEGKLRPEDYMPGQVFITNLSDTVPKER